MSLECLNGIITDNLAIQIDLTKQKSWNLNTGFTSYSLTKWAGAISDNINLIDFGLTGFDNGRTNTMWSGLTLTPNDTLFTMYRVGYNTVNNPTSGNTGGITATTQYAPYNIIGVTTGNIGNYFELQGGYLQGFYKLNEYNYELLPSRFNHGVTIETLLRIDSGSSGIFYMMGLRAEDKYNSYFSGETTVEGNNVSGNTVDITSVSGVTTSENNYLDAFYEVPVNRKAFASWENRKKIEYKEFPVIDNIKNNVIAFFITDDHRLGYKYVDDKGFIVVNTSSNPINVSGWTMIAIVFSPDEIIQDPQMIDCFPQRTGKLKFYINGRAQWIVNEFPEFYFRAIKNQREKQIGVPFSISWGGGSFGLRYSYHYDYQKYVLYNGQDTEYINRKFWVQNNPLAGECEPIPSNDYLPGLLLSADTTTFVVRDNCDPSIEHPLTVMAITYTGATASTATTYFIKFNQPVSVLSNREYVVNLQLFNSGFFSQFSSNGMPLFNKAKIIVYGSVDIDIINETYYSMPLTTNELLNIDSGVLKPFPDREEYEYIVGGTIYYGATGIPVADANAIMYGLMPNNSIAGDNIVSGENGWKPLKLIFKSKDNSGKQIVYIGLLLESTHVFNSNNPLYINNFTYTAADILVQDPQKDDLLIQQNFDNSYLGAIQKLRVYNMGLNSSEVLHNAIMESKLNPYLNMKISKGGRIIYR